MRANSQPAASAAKRDVRRQATPPQGPGGHQNNAGDSLVNVQIGDITVLAPIGIAANICDVNVNVLARQLRDGGATCTSDASDQVVDITQM